MKLGKTLLRNSYAGCIYAVSITILERENVCFKYFLEEKNYISEAKLQSDDVQGI